MQFTVSTDDDTLSNYAWQYGLLTTHKTDILRYCIEHKQKLKQ